jgi:hypothetical protein
MYVCTHVDDTCMYTCRYTSTRPHNIVCTYVELHVRDTTILYVHIPVRGLIQLAGGVTGLCAAEWRVLGVDHSIASQGFLGANVVTGVVTAIVPASQCIPKHVLVCMHVHVYVCMYVRIHACRGRRERCAGACVWLCVCVRGGGGRAGRTSTG